MNVTLKTPHFLPFESATSSFNNKTKLDKTKKPKFVFFWYYATFFEFFLSWQRAPFLIFSVKESVESNNSFILMFSAIWDSSFFFKKTRPYSKDCFLSREQGLGRSDLFRVFDELCKHDLMTAFGPRSETLRTWLFRKDNNEIIKFLKSFWCHLCLFWIDAHLFRLKLSECILLVIRFNSSYLIN